jgi:outer membrane protein OmpA-like peptidoglycan-associated protein
MKSTTSLRLLPLMVAALLAAGCASTPRIHPDVLALQDQMHRLRGDPRIAANAQPELRDAELAVSVIAADARRMSPVAFDQSIYLARRLIMIAEAEGLARHAVQRSAQLDGERERLLVSARERDAMIARRAADDARRAAEDARLQASDAHLRASDAARRADEERRMGEMARLRAEEDRRAAELARMDAERARQEADQARRSMADLQVALVELQAKQTERGLVLTVGDVLFEVDRADLKPGATRQLDKVVTALRDRPDLTLVIEGHTDSTGAASYNLDLSERRAAAVRQYLVLHGVASNRLRSRGLGEDYPVASNNDPAGRQQNRRVEIVLQDQAARVAERDD